jgi:predicted MFS family arabinose efflux permease
MYRDPVNESRTSPFLVVFALWLLVFSASSQIMIISPILPRIGEELAIREGLLGTLVSAYSLMVGVFALISGPISDRVGRRRILLLGTGIMTLALLLHGLVDGYASFLAVRIFSGIAGGVLSGAAVSYIGDYFPYNKRGWATGWVMSGNAFGQIAGIPLGVILAGSYGFKAPFYVFAVTMAMTFVLLWARVPQPPVELHGERLTLAGSIRGYREIMALPGVAAGAVGFFLMFLGVSFYVVYLPTWLELEFGASATQIATLFLVGGVANVLTGPQAGKWSDRVGRKPIILFSCVGLSVVMLFTTLVVKNMTMAYPVFFVVMVLVAMRISPFSALLTALVADNRRGVLMSFSVALGQVGFAVGGALAGPLFAGPGYWSNTLLGALAVLGMGIIVWLKVPEPRVDRDSRRVEPFRMERAPKTVAGSPEGGPVELEMSAGDPSGEESAAEESAPLPPRTGS